MQEEVVQRVRPDPVFRALDRAVRAGGDQFGRDFGVQDRLQHGIGIAVELVGGDAPADQELDQGLGHAGIDRVVTHLVADAVGAPAERQFRKITGADDQPAALVGEAKEVVGAEPRLHVLERHVIVRLAAIFQTSAERVAQVIEHLAGGGADIDLVARHPQRAHQGPGVGLGILAGRETGHREAEDVIARASEPVHDLGRDDQRMGGIEPAGHADDQPFGACGDKALEQALDLDVERLVAIGVELFRCVGHEGEAADRAGQADIREVGLVVEAYAPKVFLRVARETCSVVERAVAHPLLFDALGIDIRQHDFGIVAEAVRFREQFAQFVDRALAVPRQIGGALARPGGGIDISANRPRAVCR